MNFAKFDKDWTLSGGVKHKIVEQSISQNHLIRASDKKIVIGREMIQLESGNSATREEIKNRIRELWGNEEAEWAFENIIKCESGWHTDIISTTGDVGLWQINLAAHWKEIVGDSRAEKITNLQNWEYNTQFAFWLWQREGWGPWVCSRIHNYK